MRQDMLKGRRGRDCQPVLRLDQCLCRYTHTHTAIHAHTHRQSRQGIYPCYTTPSPHTHTHRLTHTHHKKLSRWLLATFVNWKISAFSLCVFCRLLFLLSLLLLFSVVVVATYFLYPSLGVPLVGPPTNHHHQLPPAVHCTPCSVLRAPFSVFVVVSNKP